MNDKEPLYSIKWTQTYPGYNHQEALDALTEILVESYLDEGWFDEANAEITRIMKL